MSHVQKYNKRNRKVSKRKYKQSKPKRRMPRSKNNDVFELPTINNSPIQTRCLRYIGTITSSTTISSSSLLGIMVGCTNASTSYFNLIESLRVRRVGVIVLPASDTNAGTFSFIWNGGSDRVPEIRKTMLYTQGVPAKWNFYPPDESLASFWLDTSTSTALFELDPDNSTAKIVVDLDFEYVLGTGGQTTGSLSSASTFTGVGYRYLDWASGGADELSPVDLDLVN